MKYYKNLIKRKQYFTLTVCLILFILGGTMFFYNFIDVIIRNINLNDLSSYTVYNNGLIGIIGFTNIGMSLIGAFIMYIGIVWLPLNSPYAQDDSDYDIKSEGDYINIKFKKNEFLVKKETFQPTDLFFRDKNKRFVSMTRGYQIYNYIMMQYKELTEREVNQSKVILKSEVVNKFSNVKKMSNEEKINFIRQHKLKDKPRLLFIITSILLWANFIFWFLGILVFIITDFTIVNFVVALIMSIGSFILGRKSNAAIMKNKILIKRILSDDMYIVECQIFDRKHNQTQDADGISNDNYYIKITDGNYVVDQWIEIPKEKYNNKNNDVVKFYVFDQTGSDYFLIY